MPDLYPNTTRFLRSLHRRLFWVRLAERVGICVAAVAGIAMLMVPLLMIRGRSGPGFCVTTLMGATVAGFAWGISRRPSRLDAAMLADQQLRLHDLLGTAVLLARSGMATADAWQTTVLALADARCRELSPSDVLFRRWGGRAWGSTGLLVTLAMTLAFLSVEPAPTAARQTAASFNLSPSQSVHNLIERENANGPAASSVPRPFRPSPSVEDRDPSSGSEASAAQEAARNGSRADLPSAAPPGSTSNERDAGPGSATGRQSKPLAMPQANTAGTSSSPVATKTASGGGATSMGLLEGVTAGRTGATAGSQTARPPSAPWQTATWSTDSHRAQDEARDRRLPDTYRSLISDYFRED